MKAIVQDRYGSPAVLELRDIARPTIVADQVLVKIRAASVNAIDWHFMRGYKPARPMSGERKPNLPVRGVDLAGIVESVGHNVSAFKVGDEVFGLATQTFAEYAVASPGTLVHKPAGMSFERAAAVGVAATTALQGLRDKAKIRAGQRVLINGAGGGVGTFAVQIAKALGAHVTAVTSTRNMDLVAGLGADVLIDYKKTDFTRGSGRYDAIFDVAANRTAADLRRVLVPGGTLVRAGAPRESRFTATARSLLSRARRRSVIPGPGPVLFMSQPNQSDLLVLKGLIEAGNIVPVIDRTFPLRAVPEALRYLGSGRARAKVVIAISAATAP